MPEGLVALPSLSKPSAPADKKKTDAASEPNQMQLLNLHYEVKRLVSNYSCVRFTSLFFSDSKMENVIFKARRDSTDAVAVTPPTDGPHPVVRGKITT